MVLGKHILQAESSVYAIQFQIKNRREIAKRHT